MSEFFSLFFFLGYLYNFFKNYLGFVILLMWVFQIDEANALLLYNDECDVQFGEGWENLLLQLCNLISVPLSCLW